MAQKERLLSLDVMRGITIAAMLLVNNPGSWSHIYAPLRHASWHGMTPTDLIYPFFMFIMGVSMHFSLIKYKDAGLNSMAFSRIAKRSLLMFVVGLGLQAVSYIGYGLSAYLLGRTPEGTTLAQAIFPIETFRIMGVMQGLAIAYFFGSIIILAIKWRYILWIAGGILVAYIIVLHLGNGYVLAENNIIAIVDRAVLGAKHLYQETLAYGTKIPFEPEAILSSIPRVAHVMLGVYVGHIITKIKNNDQRTNHLFIFGTIILFTGLLLQYGDPINKKLWTSSYTLISCGFGSLLLALLIWIIDIRKHAKWSTFFEVYGINPLFLYVIGWVLSVLFGLNLKYGETITSVKGFLYNNVFQPILGNELNSLAYALFFVCVTWLFGYILYRKKIYVKL